ACELDERCDAAVHVHPTLIREQHAGDQAQQRRLPLAVAADDADGLTRLHGEGHVSQRPELPRPRAPGRAGEEVLEVATPAPVAAEMHAETFHIDRCVHQSSFRTVLSSDRNTQMPSARISTLMSTLRTTVKVCH